MERQQTIVWIKDELSALIDELNDVTDDLSNNEVDPSALGNAFQRLIRFEKRTWMLLPELEDSNVDPESNYKIRAMLTNTQPGYRGLPTILSGLRLLNQLQPDELRNLLLSGDKQIPKIDGIKTGVYGLLDELVKIRKRIEKAI